MRFLNPEVLPGEPIYIELEAMNKSSIALPYWWNYMSPLFFELDGKQCKPWIRLRDSGKYFKTRKEFSDSQKIHPDLRQPGFSELLIVYINDICSIKWNKDKTIDYGNHEFCYFWDEQNKICATFFYKEPTGIDAEAFALFKERKSLEILRDYPTSIYAAWINYAGIFRPELQNAEKVVDLIHANFYPEGNAVRDANGEDHGFKSVARGKPMAAWAKEKSLLILKNHPDFIFSDKLKLIIAICDIVLRKESEGIKQIQDLIQAEEEKIKASTTDKLMSNDIQWAKKFLEAWEKKKI